MVVNILTKNFTSVSNISQIPFNKVGARFTLTAYHPGCGWCGKLFEESVNKQCDALGKKGIPCLGINAGEAGGQNVMKQLGLKPAFPQTYMCTVGNKGADGKPKVDCAVGEGWFPADAYAKALQARGFI